MCLVDGVLDLSKIEAGRMELAPVDFDLTVLVQGLAAIFSQRCQQKGLRLQVENLGRTGVWLHGDERKLRQVLVNLLSNAVKFTDQGEVRLRVVPVGASGTYRFEVIDTGPGIPMAAQKEIFEPFKQEAAGQAKGGTGLGLSIARRLIELMGGSLEVNSSPGWGSNFFFALSLLKANTLIPSLAGEPMAPFRLAPTCPVRALVVDDLSINRDILAQMLSALGCEVMTAASGAEALEIAQTTSIEIVFMDIRMPGMDGIATTQALRTLLAAKPPKFVSYSASAFEHERQQTELAGFDDFLSKPFRLERVTECLASLPGVRFSLPSDEWHTHLLSDLATLHLPEASVSQLRAAAEIGDITTLRQALVEIERLGPAAAEFSRRMWLFAERFDTDAILATLNEFSAPAGLSLS